ncbi:ATP-binding protein [Pleionea sp. CnH1-48]|uniref:ATP-binding protein n=1 Tax=Pleionea sp. CnH1-48 TaxID=2954494 RepID=UPI002097C1D5|nr:ATP-binding protein [Pleionea sp. CnH1-48]MCO7223500.1 ATP-binding protein [Pleionea sp. CnH1-48]
MFSSLKFRLTLLVSISLIVLTSAVAWVLVKAFEQSLQSQLQDRMQTQMYMILTAADEDKPGQLLIPEVVHEETFNQIDSGNYAFALDKDNTELWRSFSAVDLNSFAAEKSAPGDFEFDQIVTNDIGYFRMRYSVIWESNDGSEHFYQFIVLHEASQLYDVIDEFQMTLWSWLAFVFAAMFIVQLVALRWGLSPLRHIAYDLAKIESGEQTQLSAKYPKELKPLTQNLNILIETERTQRERYRQTLSNLAHSLKTPLAVIQGSLGQDISKKEFDKLLSQQVVRMNEIVQYQLNRAVTGQKSHMLASVNVNENIEKILAALQKVYARKALSVEFIQPEPARFYGNAGDLMEFMGNILDNAFKWTATQVRVSLQVNESPQMYGIKIIIEDDGPGVPPEKRINILQRGKRLDEQVEGQGIGLSVVAEIIHQYGGSIVIDDSELGGAKFELAFEFDRV